MLKMKQSIPLPPHHCIAQLSITTAELLLTVYSRYPRVHWDGYGSGRCMVYSDLRTSSLRQGNWLAVTRLFPPLDSIPSPIPLQSFSHWRESKHYVLCFAINVTVLQLVGEQHEGRLGVICFPLNVSLNTALYSQTCRSMQHYAASAAGRANYLQIILSGLRTLAS